MRRFLTAKALGLGLVALVLIVAFVAMGLWQFRVYDDHRRADSTASLHEPAVALDQVFGPDDAFPDGGVGKPVRVTGVYLPTDQVYVTDLPGSQRRYAVATPLRTSNGSAIIVVRGSTDRIGEPAPTGPVTVTGVLEPAGDAGRIPDRRGVTDQLSIASLVDRVHPDLYSGYVLLRTSAPRQAPELAAVAAPLPDPSRWAGLRNLLYACQWWVFAAFVAFMWWRMTADLAAHAQPAGMTEDIEEGRLETLR